jgi:hypothetical protein
MNALEFLQRGSDPAPIAGEIEPGQVARRALISRTGECEVVELVIVGRELTPEVSQAPDTSPELLVEAGGVSPPFVYRRPVMVEGPYVDGGSPAMKGADVHPLRFVHIAG